MDVAGQCVTVVTSVTDILAVRIARSKDDSLIQMVSPGTGTSSGRVFSIREIRSSADGLNDCVLFCHAITRCDTTSVFYRVGKQKAWELLKMKSDLREWSAVFLNSQSGKADIATTGEKLVAGLYCGSETDNVEQLRVVCTCTIKAWRRNRCQPPLIWRAFHQQVLPVSNIRIALISR